MSIMTCMMALIVLSIGGLLAATPYLMPPTECFAVSVPPSAKQDPRVQAIYRRYVAIVAVGTLACAAIPIVGGGSEVSIVIAVFAPLILGVGAMLHARSKVRALKEQEGWHANGQRAAAFVADETVPRPLPLAWNLLFLVLAAAFAIAGVALYERFPEQVPMQTSLDGTVTRYADRSLATVLFPALLTLFFGLVIAACHWMIVRSKKPIDPASPASSALAYGSFARAQSIMLLAGGLLLCAAIGIMYFATSLGALPMASAAPLVAAVALAFVIAEMALAVAQGQSGARMAGELRASDELSADDDEHWLLGSIYFNPDDASFVVPKRFGVGWTVNMGNRLGWLAIGALLALSLAFAFGIEILMR